MKDKKRGEIILSIFFLAFFIMLTVISLGYSAKSRRLPLIVGIPGIALACVEVYRRSIKRPPSAPRRKGARGAHEADEEDDAGTVDFRKAAAMIGWVALLVVMIWIFGFLVTIPSYTLLFMKVRKESWLASILFAGIGFAALYVLFIVALHIELYPGLIFKP
jgi:hypothetical protein